jgi:hypothetical protein
MKNWNAAESQITSRIRLIVCATAFAVALPRAALADQIIVPPVPVEVAVDAGNVPFLLGHGVGTQNYVCLPSGAGVAFKLFTPEATLLGDDAGEGGASVTAHPRAKSNTAMLPGLRRSASMMCAIALGLSGGCTAEGEREDEGFCSSTRICRGERISACLYDATHCGDGDQCLICPNPTAPHEVAACLGRQCGSACDGSHADCNGLQDDGCEVDVASDAMNCGGCGIRCHGDCAQGACNARWEGEASVVALSDGPFLGRVRVFWLRSDSGMLDVRSGPFDGGDAVTVASVPAIAGVPPVAVQDDGGLYFCNGGALQPDGDGGIIYRLALDTKGAVPALLADAQDAPGGILLVGGMLYWTNHSGGQVMRIPVAGGIREVVADGQNHPRALANDDQRLFWVNEGTDAGDGSVMTIGFDGGAPALISTDSTLPGGIPSPTAAAPTAISMVWLPLDVVLPGHASKFPVWADRASGVVWASPDGRPVAVTYPFNPGSAWDPRHLFLTVENVSVFNLGTQAVYGLDRLYIPGSAPYEPPFHWSLLGSVPGITMFSERGFAATDGGTVQAGYRN